MDNEKIISVVSGQEPRAPALLELFTEQEAEERKAESEAEAALWAVFRGPFDHIYGLIGDNADRYGWDGVYECDEVVASLKYELFMVPPMELPFCSPPPVTLSVLEIQMRKALGDPVLQCAADEQLTKEYIFALKDTLLDGLNSSLRVLDRLLRERRRQNNDDY